jgi:hypothetical protein
MNKIFKTTLMLVSLIVGFGYAEKARYDNEDEDEEMEYDYGKSQAEIKEETHRVYGTFFEKRRYGIKVSVASAVNNIFDVNNGGAEAGIGIITSIPLSKDGPFKIESGIESNFSVDFYEDPDKGGSRSDRGYVVFRIPVLLDYYPLSLTVLPATTLGGDGRIVMSHFKAGVFFDWKYDEEYDGDKDEYSQSISFDSPGVIFTLGFKAHKDGTNILANHLAMEAGISYKKKVRLDMNFFYFF